MDREYATVGYVNFLFGVWCSTWARNSGRDPWGWFFFGLFLAPIAGIVLAGKHRDDHREAAG